MAFHTWQSVLHMARPVLGYSFLSIILYHCTITLRCIARLLLARGRMRGRGDCDEIERGRNEGMGGDTFCNDRGSPQAYKYLQTIRQERRVGKLSGLRLIVY